MACPSTTSYAPGVSETLTTGLTAIKEFNLKKGKTIRRTIVIDGSCDAVNMKSGSNPAAVPNPGCARRHCEKERAAQPR
jgi:hypothetical protein